MMHGWHAFAIICLAENPTCIAPFSCFFFLSHVYDSPLHAPTLVHHHIDQMTDIFLLPTSVSSWLCTHPSLQILFPKPAAFHFFSFFSHVFSPLHLNLPWTKTLSHACSFVGLATAPCLFITRTHLPSQREPFLFHHVNALLPIIYARRLSSPCTDPLLVSGQLCKTM